jgi:hypothetical protein
VAWLTDDVPREGPPEARQKRRGGCRIEGQTRRKLKQQGPELRPEARHLGQEAIQAFVRADQAPRMRDRPRHLHGEAEPVRHRGGPPRVGRHPVGSIEGRVDLDRGEKLRVPLQMAAGFGEVRGVDLRQAPAGGSKGDGV